MKKFSLNAIQKSIASAKLDGWLFYDFMGSDPVGRSILGVISEPVTSRRWFYFIPAHGVSVKLVHALEKDILDHLPGKKEVYIGYVEMIKKLESFLPENSKLAVQYSVKNALPMISRLDAGMFELLKSFKLQLVSSVDLVQQFDACLSRAEINTHVNAATELQTFIDKTIRFIRRRLKNHEEVNELSVQNFLHNQLQNKGMVSALPQIIAVGPNTSNPRYYPTDKNNRPIRDKSLIQLSLRARDKNENAIYASSSWILYVGKEIPEVYRKNFRILKETRDGTCEFLKNAMTKPKPVQGWEVDEFARKLIEKEELNFNYLHRTGHSLGNAFYGNGVNLDNLETRDERIIIPGLCFTVVPGIYFSDYGMRSEVNLYIDTKGVHISSPRKQDEIVQILPE